MAQSRLEKIGSIFNRVTGLLRSGAVKYENRPLWYDVYEAFPPEQEPRFDRPVKDIELKEILYPEDVFRAEFARRFGGAGVVSLTEDRVPSTKLSNCQRVLQRIEELRACNANTEPTSSLFDNAVDSLTGEGVDLKASVFRRARASSRSVAAAKPSVVAEELLSTSVDDVALHKHDAARNDGASSDTS